MPNTAQKWKHGLSGYSNHQCRCTVCKSAAKAYYSKKRGPLKRRPNGQHGTRARYDQGCRCAMCSDYRAAQHRLHTYNLTDEAYQAMLATQENACAICRKPNPKSVDHDHVTGAVRGLLCQSCNTGLGFFKDNTEIMRTAINYLEERG